MKNFLLDLAQWFLVLLIRVRYRITYKGLDQVKLAVKQSSKGCLFLPNHPAILVDPLIILDSAVRNGQEC